MQVESSQHSVQSAPVTVAAVEDHVDSKQPYVIDRKSSTMLKSRFEEDFKKITEAHEKDKSKRGLLDYYKNQYEVMTKMKELVDAKDDETVPPDNLSARADKAVKATVAVNITLFILKLIVAILSGSLVLLASMIDSLLDLTVNFMLYLASKASRNADKYLYPVGRNRLQSMGIVIFSALMGMASIQIMLTAGDTLYTGIFDKPEVIEMSPVSIGILVVVIVAKFFLMRFCRKVDDEFVAALGRSNGVVEALAQDHQNDVVSNAVSLVIALLASYIPKIWFFDPLGAIAISLLILIGWVERGKEQIDQLVGKSAGPDFISKVAYFAMKFDDRILAVDTVTCYHLGSNVIAEVHILLPENMPLVEAHDIGQRLEDKLETWPTVERAYVHLDVETDHKPEHVVKIVD
jgi:cation diffusion facilitator family transporter